MRPSLIIFDCDGVLIDSELISARALIDELACYGADIDLAFIARHCIGRSYPTVVEAVERERGVRLPAQCELDYRARLLAAFETGLTSMVGIEDALEALDVPYCLATSSSPTRLAASLRITGLERFFSGRAFTASEVKRGKPAPDLFLHAAASMGVPPDQCAVVEDSTAGLLAARAAGMEVWHFTGGSHFAVMELPAPDALVPDRRFASVAELRGAMPDLFRQIAAVDPA
ncbi:HAD family hydrolase [Ancylobacter lacus]|uniref:HAD family hydrolase n=1 Tax=Ancylobacter lacus TaxID=2579970 RepID=UPI001BCD5F97|nr:HAD family hydrolase [Ancylobacter lacus]MBS7541237.1 HAD family hydrolase [Ancylobacter lacus]